MSGHQGGYSNTLSHPNCESCPSRTPAWPHYPSLRGANSLKHPHPPSGLEYSGYNSGSPKLPVRRICMGRPYNSKCVETSHLANCPKEARKPTGQGSPHCLLCTDRPSGPASPTFLDQLIKGISYLDRSTNAFCTKSSLSLPRLAASYLERAANSIHLDQQDSPHPRCNSYPSTSRAASSISHPSTCMMQPSRDGGALQAADDASNMTCPFRPYHRNPAPLLQQRPAIKLPELPLFGNGIFALDRLPKFWEAIRSGWRAPEPTSKPCNWW